MKNTKYCFALLMLLFLSCQPDKNSISEKYIGFFATTDFSYEFDENNNFVFETFGHLGNDTIYGKYAMVDSMLLLYPYTDSETWEGVFDRRFIIKSDFDYIRNFYFRPYIRDTYEEADGEDNYDEIISKLNALRAYHHGVLDSIENRLLELDEIVKITECYPNYKKDDVLESPHFSYEGIMLIDNQEYHQFEFKHGYIVARSKDFQEPPIIQKYLVNTTQNSIYRHLGRYKSPQFVKHLFN